MLHPLLASAALSLLPVPHVRASEALQLPGVFGDHMVLQREKPARVWGQGTPGATVSVTLGEHEATGEVARDGSFDLRLPPLEASLEPRTLRITSGAEECSFEDVLVGEVWVCGGQSNMEWQLRASRDADLELSSRGDPAVRFLRLPKIASDTPQQDFPVAGGGSSWRACVPGKLDHCTAVGYYFARRLRRNLEVPVGLIDISWGGTLAQHWVRRETLQGFETMQPHLAAFEARRVAWEEGGREDGARKRYEADLAAWDAEREAAVQRGEREPRKPQLDDRYKDPATLRQPGGMMNGMVLPVAPFTLRGALFYQGENNSFGEAWKPFPQTFPAVLSDWREVFGEPTLPIGVIQIAGWSNRRSMTYDMNHHTNIVREIQQRTCAVTPGTGLIVTYDTNSNGSIHPGHKRPVGERAARWALAEVYAGELDWRGPRYESMVVEGDKAIISFAEEGRRGLRLDRDMESGLYVAGADRVFHHARARVISEERLQVWSELLETPPVAVRYAWSNLPAGGLMNARELPACPFRTDAWPLTPHQSTGSYEREP